MAKKFTRSSLIAPALLKSAVAGAFVKLAPHTLVRRPVMFTVEVASATALFFTIRDALVGRPFSVSLLISLWLWLTVLFGNFAEAAAEGRGKAQADSLRKSKTETLAKRVTNVNATEFKTVSSSELRAGDLIVAEAGDIIAGDGDVVRGIATIDESSVTGESAPVIRESGGGRSAVTGGTRVITDRIVVEITADPGASFLDRMIGLVEGARRQKTFNEIALMLFLVGITLIFLFVCVTLEGFAAYSGNMIPVIYLIALFVVLIPTTIGGLMSAIGIAGMDRLVTKNVISKSGRAVEAACDTDILLLDKTGTITFGNRLASAFIPTGGAREKDLAEVAMLSSLADETPEGKSIVHLAEERFGLDAAKSREADMRFIPFTSRLRMSGVDTDTISIRKGAADSILSFCEKGGNAEVLRMVELVAKTGGTPLLVAKNKTVLGVIHLKDIIKPGIHERFAILRRMGIRTVMITGDNPITAAAIAAEAGVDDFLAEASPEKKLELIRSEQAEGKRVAMCGDGSDDAPALAQADIGVAMSTGTMAAREAANMIDLDSDPTKMIEIVTVGKQLLITRGALTIFSLATDIGKYFALLPALLAGVIPGLRILNVLQLASPESAILSTVVFNALCIPVLTPLALRGVSYAVAQDSVVLRKNLFVFGAGGIVAALGGIKAIDWVVRAVVGVGG